MFARGTPPFARNIPVDCTEHSFFALIIPMFAWGVPFGLHGIIPWPAFERRSALGNAFRVQEFRRSSVSWVTAKSRDKANAMSTARVRPTGLGQRQVPMIIMGPRAKVKAMSRARTKESKPEG